MARSARSRHSLERILGWPLSVQALETAAREDAVDVTAVYERPVEAEPTAAATDTILVAQADSKGAPPNRMREAVVTTLYTIAPYPRPPEAVAAALLPETERAASAPRPRPIQKELRAPLDGKAVALARLADRARRRDGPRNVDRVALTDGAHALQGQMRTARPGHTLVLDIIQSVECLWSAANALLGERHPDRTTWVRTQVLVLLHGQVATLVATLTAAVDASLDLPSSRRDAVATTIGYYQRNAPYMRYDQYLARGWPIGTGLIERACGHLVKDRLQQAGMRWTTAGAHAVLDLRAIRLADHGDACWAFHRRRQHARLYGSSGSQAGPPDAQFLTLPQAA